MPRLLTKAFAELLRSKATLERLFRSRAFQISEDAWIGGVSSVERVWALAHAGLRDVHGFSDFETKFVGLRRSDVLLQYVNQARNAAEHTIEDSFHLTSH